MLACQTSHIIDSPRETGVQFPARESFFLLVCIFFSCGSEETVCKPGMTMTRGEESVKGIDDKLMLCILAGVVRCRVNADDDIFGHLELPIATAAASFPDDIDILVYALHAAVFAENAIQICAAGEHVYRLGSRSTPNSKSPWCMYAPTDTTPWKRDANFPFKSMLFLLFLPMLSLDALPQPCARP
jgi:hypothetical protein